MDATTQTPGPPPCRWRRANAHGAGLHACASRRLGLETAVDDAFCRNCLLCDHEPDAAIPTPPPARMALQVLPIEPQCLWLNEHTTDTYRCNCGGGGAVDLWACEQFGRCVPHVASELRPHPTNTDPPPAKCWKIGADGKIVSGCEKYERKHRA